MPDKSSSFLPDQFDQTLGNDNTASVVALEFDPSVEETINARLREKLSDYGDYGFSQHESCILNILFDLMQEFHTVALLVPLPVLLIKHTCGLDAEFYIRDMSSEGNGKFVLRTRPIGANPEDKSWLPEASCKIAHNIIADGRVCIPVRGRYIGSAHTEEDRRMLGLLVLYPQKPLSAHDLLFFEKFSNRLGFAMHNYALAQKNREHLDFVRNLVKDIGHNVLGPNMYFKLLINKLGAELLNFGQELNDEVIAPEKNLQNLKIRHLALLDQLNEVKQHFNHSSLFLESLLRESHFTHGRYVLRTTPLNLGERVVRAQYQGFLPMFKAKGMETSLDINKDAQDEVDADFGLISQVVANLFSNALKYAKVTPGAPVPFMHCTVLKHDEAGAEGARPKHGIRVNVVTSGEHIKPEEADRLFEKYFRASNTSNIAGTGKGLNFVLDIVGQHHGEAGYEATPEGNLFYFILPSKAI
jgi:signal transduction histidine kinase